MKKEFCGVFLFLFFGTGTSYRDLSTEFRSFISLEQNYK